MTRVRLRTRPFQPTLSLLAVLGIVVFGAALALSLRGDTRGKLPGWEIVAALAVVALLTALLVREVKERNRIDRAMVDATSALRSGALTETWADTGRSVADLLDDFAARVRELLNAEWAIVAVTDVATNAVRVRAVSGNTPFAEGDEIDADSVPTDTTPSRVAAPIILGDQLGVVEIGAGPGRTFRRTDHNLLQLLVDRASVLVEQARLEDVGRRSALGAAQARAHLALIAEISIVLARTLEDIRPTVREICDLLVAHFADACSVDLLSEDGTLERVAGSGGSPSTDGFGDAATLSNDEVSLRRVLASGRSELSFVKPDGLLYGVEDSLAERMQAAGMASWVVAPIRLRGLPFGTLTVATTKSRRGYRPSDQAVVDELAGRLAIAIERSVLFSHARIAGVAAERRADQLSNLLEAAIALTRSLQPADVLAALVEQSSRLLDAHYSHASFGDELEASCGEPPEAAESILGPLADHAGRRFGLLRVERDRNRSFEPDEQALLGLVARFASSALQNARLFEDVRIREQRLAALFAASPLAILEFDAHGAVSKANPAANAMFGEPDLRGDLPVDLPADLLEVVAELRTHTARGASGEAEVSLENGTDVWVSAAPLYRGVDAPPEMLVVISDTTERKRLEEQLIEAHRYEAIAQLAGGIAHDFNNLLTVIIGYSDLLLREHPDNDEIAAMHEAGRLAAVITNQLLTLSRRQVVQPVVVDLAAVCTDLAPTLQRLVGDSVHIETNCDTETRIKIDQGQLEQVLLNLVLNSRDASPHGGKIVIATRALGDGNASVSVSDEGEGMDADTLARCLEPFFTRKGRRGIGLGLATVQSIVQRAGGILEIESELGRGTTITARFPEVVGRQSEPEQGARREGVSVLLVDDDELIRRYSSTVLSGAGFRVTTAADAEEAIALMASDGTFDLLISDIVLPGINGFELVRRFHDRWPHVARLLITGYAGTDTSGTDLEDVAVLPKPFAGDDLVRAANDALP